MEKLTGAPTWQEQNEPDKGRHVESNDAGEEQGQTQMQADE